MAGDAPYLWDGSCEELYTPFNNPFTHPLCAASAALDDSTSASSPKPTDAAAAAAAAADDDDDDDDHDDDDDDDDGGGGGDGTLTHKSLPCIVNETDVSVQLSDVGQRPKSRSDGHLHNS